MIGRLVYIQLVAAESFSDGNINLLEASIRQRTEGFVLDDGRGELLGKDGAPLRDNERPALILFPFLQRIDWPSEKVADIIRVDDQALTAAVREAKAPFEFPVDLTESQMAAIRELRIPGVFAERVQHSSTEPFAEHVLGVISENPELIRQRYPEKIEEGILSMDTPIGISGLEKAFDPFLVSRGDSRLVYHTEANGEPLFGLDVRYTGRANPYDALNVRTTIARDMQQIVENAVDDVGLDEGGAVLLRARNSNLLAMVSRPLFSRDEPLGKGGENHMVLPHIPGSVFKMVTAAAVIENGAVEPGRRFNCNKTLYGDGKADRRLGMLTFEESFVQSCNAAFGEMANELMRQDDDYIETFANRLGLIGPVGWQGSVYHIDAFNHFPEETEGVVWKDESFKNNPKSVAQTAVGQLNVRISPLAVANALATIARGGEQQAVRSATAVEYENGVDLLTFPEKSPDRQGISVGTAERMQDLLREVVTSPKGTGHRLANLPYPVAGKSGTAETGADDEAVNNQWFAGYFPADHPKFVLVVLDLDHKDGEVKAYDVYERIVKQLYRLNHSSRTENETFSRNV